MVIVVFGVALTVRLICIAATADVPTIRHPIGDAAGYLAWAQRIAAGEWLGTRAFYQAPLYPYTLAVWKMFGFDSVTATRVLQAVWGSAACAMLCIAATRFFSRQVGIVAGLMLAVYAPAIYFDGIIQKASLDCLLVCAVLVCVALALDCMSLPRLSLLGTVVSLLCLTRENAMAWHLVLIAWVAWRCRIEVQQGRCAQIETGTTEAALPQNAEVFSPHINITRYTFLCLFAYLLGAAVVLLPVGIRNVYVQGEFLLTTSQAGPNFYIGNNVNADGRYQPLVRGHETPVFEQADATRLAEQTEGRSLTPREVSRFWMRQAWCDVTADPLQWLRLTGYKLLFVWNRYEIADAESIIIYRRHSTLLDGLARVWHFGVLTPLAVLGIVFTWSRRRELVVLYALILTMTLAVAAFYVLGRYRYPLVPLLVPFAAAGVIELWNRRNRLGTATKAIVAAIIVAIVVNWPVQDEARLDALAEMNAGVALAQAGAIEEAASYFARAVAGHRTSAEANYNLALALALQGKFADAIPYYQQAVAIQPDLIGVHFNLGVALEQAGQREAALRHYEIAAEQDPADVDAQAARNRLKP